MDHFENAVTSEELTHDCNDYLELRLRQKGLGTAYAYQCTFCGEAKGQEVPKRNVTGSPPAFDAGLLGRFEAKRKAIYLGDGTDPVREHHEPFFNIIDRRLRAVVDDLATEYTPEQITSGFQAFLLRQAERHTQEHPTRWKSEEELSAFVREYPKHDFELFAEVEGIGYVQGTPRRVRLDYLIRPKQHLLDAGFVDQYMGIEVKLLDYEGGKRFSGKSAKGVFQALSYWYSSATWHPPSEKEPVELACVLLFTNLSFEDERRQVFNTYNQRYHVYWRALIALAQQANVGELLILDHGPRKKGWGIDFVGSRYFSKRPSGGFRLTNPNLINRKRIGNAGRKSR